MKIKKGFTLAEVLITLGIIGVVAALTMPNLIGSYQERATVTKLKKINSTFNQAYNLAINDNGTLPNWNIQASSNLTPEDIAASKLSHDLFWDKLAPYLTVTKRMSFSNPTGQMWGFSTLSGNQNENIRPFLVLEDGIMVVKTWFYTAGANCTANLGNSPQFKRG